MVAYRRNFIFRVSIVINIIVLIYTVLHISITYPAPQLEWVQVTSNDSEESAQLRYAIEETDTSKEFHVITNRQASIQKEKSKDIWQEMNDAELTNKDLDILDEDTISETTYFRLRSLLACNNKDFLPEYYMRGKFWVLKNYIRAEHGNLKCYETVTYTTHASYNFLDNVQILLERWLAPMSLAIHAPGTDIVPTVNSIRYLRDCLGSDLIKEFVTFHIFFPFSHIPKEIPDPNKFLASSYDCSLPPPYENVNEHDMYKTRNHLFYPVNVARNIARDAALTHFILPSDIELYPSPNLVPRFLNMIARNASPLNNSTNPRVFTISLFEVDASAQVPSTKTEVIEMVAKKMAVSFHKFTCPACHSMPRGRDWSKAAETLQMDVFHVGKRQGKSVHWEPIFIGTHQDPHYDERLSWEGQRDKMSQGYILCVKDYDFMMLNNAILVHKPGIKHYKSDPERNVHISKQGMYVSHVVFAELKKLFGTKKECFL